MSDSLVDSMWRSAMTKPYSADLRERVVGAVEDGETRREAADRFGISTASAVRWHQAWREDGTVAAKPSGGSHSPLDDVAKEIIAIIEAQRDRTLDEIVVEMHRRRLGGSRTALFRFLERHAITLKKSPARQRTRPGRRGPRPTTLDPRAKTA
jgi:transposase